MFQLTRQEQLIVAFIMLALIVGAVVRMYKYSPDTKPRISEVSTSNPSNLH